MVKSASSHVQPDTGAQPTEETGGSSRRALLAASVAGVAAMFTQPASALRTRRTAPAPTVDPEYRLLKRITNGFTWAEYQSAKTMGFSAYLAKQLNYNTLAEPVVSIDFPESAMTAHELQMCDTPPGATCGAVQGIVGATIVRAALSKRQLFERMTEFWVDHFNINAGKDQHSKWLTPVSNREVMRPNAMGNFITMLNATGIDPAMLHYLDNAYSNKTSPNENYAREVMELHTLGVDSGVYDEPLIQLLALILTGRTFERTTGTPAYGLFQFDAAIHQVGPFTFLGQSINTTPIREAGVAFSILANHPATKTRIATKMCSWLLVENPPATVITAAESAYPDIKSMILAILTVANFDLVSVDQNPKYMRPYHFMLGLLKAVQFNFSPGALTIREGARSLKGYLTAFGMTPHLFGPPTGRPDTIHAWAANQKARMDFAFDLMHDRVLPGSVDPVAVFNTVGGYSLATAGAQVNQIFCAGNMDPAEEIMIQRVADQIGSTWTVSDLADLLALGALSPTFSEI